MWVPAVLLAALMSGAAPTRVTTVVRVVGSKSARSAQSIAEAATGGLRWLLNVEIPSYDRRARLDDEVRRCGEDNACVVERLASSGVDLGVYVVANFDVDPPLVTIELLDTARRRAIARDIVDVAGADLERAIAASVERALVKTGLEVGGAVVADVVPREAELSLDERLLEPGVATPARAGPHVIRGRLDGYLSSERLIEIEPRREERVALELETKPGITSQWWFWTAIAVVVAGSAVAVAVVAQPDTMDVCHPVGLDTCPR